MTAFGAEKLVCEWRTTTRGISPYNLWSANVNISRKGYLVCPLYINIV